MKTAILLFAGAGGSHLTGKILKWHPFVSVELAPFCRKILQLRYPMERVHDDIRTFDATRYKQDVELVAGGFPCTQMTNAVGGARQGLEGEDSGLWFEMLRVVTECKPDEVFIENVRGLLSPGRKDFLAIVRGLSAIGYWCEWVVSQASELGAPHLRTRVWILAKKRPAHAGWNDAPIRAIPTRRTKKPMWPSPTTQDAHNNAGASQWDRNVEPLNVAVAKAEGVGPGKGVLNPAWVSQLMGWPEDWLDVDVPRVHLTTSALENSMWPSAPGRLQESFELSRLLTDPGGFPNRVAALTALGNGWVPAQAADAYRRLQEAF